MASSANRRQEGENMGHLDLACLGSPEVRHDGRMLTYRTRKTLALLVYLVAERGMHSREKITSLFWLESDEPQGRAMLRNTLLYLRQALEDHEPSHPLVDRHPSASISPRILTLTYRLWKGPLHRL